LNAPFSKLRPSQKYTPQNIEDAHFGTYRVSSGAATSLPVFCTQTLTKHKNGQFKHEVK